MLIKKSIHLNMPSCLDGNPCWFFRSKMMKTCPDPVAEHSYFDSPGVNLNPCWAEWNPFPSETSAGLKPSSSLMKTLSQQSLQKNASKTKRISTYLTYTRTRGKTREEETWRQCVDPGPQPPRLLNKQHLDVGYLHEEDQNFQKQMT